MNKPTNVLIDVYPVLLFLKNNIDTNGEEDPLFYKGLLDFIIITALDNEELSGTRGESFNDAMAIVNGVVLNDELAYNICTKALDTLIAILTTHIPDLDHDKFTDTIHYDIRDNSQVLITVTPSSYARKVDFCIEFTKVKK